QHSGHLNLLVQHIYSQLNDKTILSIQNPLELSHYSEPEPDIMLLKPNPTFYKERHPREHDVLLLIEISDHSLAFDQQQKLKLYAQHQISDYWIINLGKKCVEVYRNPQGSDYLKQQILYKGENIQPLNYPTMTLEIATLF
ncbi:MAG: Uma2 family endonuclease, partial [Methylococcales bacterium]|nr:Uma2 family endonuclease [Methylococcales bacterium]